MNVSIIRGRMTADPELRTTQNGNSVTVFTVAVSRMRGDNETDFVRCKAWGKSAEFASQYLHKGDRVGVQGKIRVDKYEKDGQNRESWCIAVDQFDLIETKRESGAAVSAAQTQSPAPEPQMETLEPDADLPF